MTLKYNKLTTNIQATYKDGKASSVSVKTEGILSNGETFCVSSYHHPRPTGCISHLEIGTSPEHYAAHEHHDKLFQQAVNEYFPRTDASQERPENKTSEIGTVNIYQQKNRGNSMEDIEVMPPLYGVANRIIARSEKLEQLAHKEGSEGCARTFRSEAVERLLILSEMATQIDDALSAIKISNAASYLSGNKQIKFLQTVGSMGDITETAPARSPVETHFQPHCHEGATATPSSYRLIYLLDNDSKAQCFRRNFYINGALAGTIFTSGRNGLLSEAALQAVVDETLATPGHVFP